MWAIYVASTGLHPDSYPVEVALTNGAYEYRECIRPLDRWGDRNRNGNPDADAYDGRLRFPRRIDGGQEASVVARSLNTILDGETVYSRLVTWVDFWVRVLFLDCGVDQTFNLRCAEQRLSASSTPFAISQMEHGNLDSGGTYPHSSGATVDVMEEARSLWFDLNVGAHCIH